MPQRSILVADDIDNQTDSGKRRSQAIRNAATFVAQRLKTHINLLYVEDLRTYAFRKLGSFHYLGWHSTHQERLEEIGSQYALPVSSSLMSGSPAEQILKVLQSGPSPELIVVGTQGRKGVKRLLIGSVAEEVVRHSKRLVMVIGPLAQYVYSKFPRISPDRSSIKYWCRLISGKTAGQQSSMRSLLQNVWGRE